MTPVRIAVLGTSAIAQRRTIPAIADTDSATLVAIASRDLDRALRCADAFGVEPHVGYESVLMREDVDAVYVPLPNSLHHEWIRAALELGKHVLAEKPMTTTASDTTELVDLARARGLVLQENFAFLHHGQHRVVREMVDSGRLGTVRNFRSEFCFPPLAPSDVRYDPRLGGGALLDVGVYTVRSAQYFLGNSLTVVGAALDIDPDTGVDVGGSALLTSGDGVMAQLSFGFQHTYGSRYSLWGSRARLDLDGAFTPPPTSRPRIRIEEQDHLEESVLPAENQFENSVARFVAAVDGRAPQLPTDDSVATAVLVEQIAHAARRSVTVG